MLPGKLKNLLAAKVYAVLRGRFFNTKQMLLHLVRVMPAVGMELVAGDKRAS